MFRNILKRIILLTAPETSCRNLKRDIIYSEIKLYCGHLKYLSIIFYHINSNSAITYKCWLYIIYFILGDIDIHMHTMKNLYFKLYFMY